MVSHQRTRPIDELRHDLSVEGIRRSPRTMTDRELLRSWRTSYIRLRRFRTVPGAELVWRELMAERTAYLDELVTRYPDAFARWGSAAETDVHRPAPHRGREAIIEGTT